MKVFGMGSLIAMALAGCAVTDEMTARDESDLSTTVLTPIQGECTTTKSIDRVTAAGSDVMRASCTVTCKKRAVSMGIWNVSLNKPDGSAVFADNLGPSATRTAHADAPYAPGFYSVSCASMWQEKADSTHFFGSGGTFVGGTF
jgi:hypothetical protein